MGLCLILGPTALGLMFVDTERFLVASFVTLGALFAFAIVVVRCPACGEMPEDDEGLLLDPDECASCGARLK